MSVLSVLSDLAVWCPFLSCLASECIQPMELPVSMHPHRRIPEMGRTDSAVDAAEITAIEKSE